MVAADDVISTRTEQIVLVQDSKGLGTGLLVGDDGWIVTNRHVAPGVGPYRVVLADGKNIHAVGVHQSHHHDLAILKIAGAHESWLDLEREVADLYHVGEEVWALGHPRGCRFSVSRGIISNPHREVEGDYYVQTDVAINPGNSGGPLVDGSGRLIGIVTLMFAGSHGLGFAVPGHIAADYARHVRRLVRQEVVKIPEELLEKAAAKGEDATEVLRNAVELLMQVGDASVDVEKPEEGYIEISKKTSKVRVRCANEVLSVRGQVAMLGTAEQQNAQFLLTLLRANGTAELGGASFRVDDQALEVGVMRPTTGLDVLEAFWAIDHTLKLVTTWSKKVNELFYQSGTDAQDLYPKIPMPKLP